MSNKSPHLYAYPPIAPVDYEFRLNNAIDSNRHLLLLLVSAVKSNSISIPIHTGFRHIYTEVIIDNHACRMKEFNIFVIMISVGTMG